jgi:ribosomal protein S18 acetylase RimI-like enzyme
MQSINVAAITPLFKPALFDRGGMRFDSCSRAVDVACRSWTADIPHRDREVHLGTLTVRTMTSTDQAQAIDTVLLAFAADPVARWTWPHPHQYVSSMPSQIRAFGGNAFTHGGAYCTDEYAGAALWLPPGVHPDEETLDEIMETTVSASIRGDARAVFEQMATYHPEGPHWYLPLIGVDPAHQGKGHGDALMTYALQRCDRDHAPAYLESTNPRNTSLYRRHGFEALGTIQVGSSPPLVPMLRPAR